MKIFLFRGQRVTLAELKQHFKGQNIMSIFNKFSTREEREQELADWGYSKQELSAMDDLELDETFAIKSKHSFAGEAAVSRAFDGLLLESGQCDLDDDVAISEAFSNYVDALERDGVISAAQAYYYVYVGEF